MITRLSIGEFSKTCKVSTKTLRYYDEIGLSTQKTLILKWIWEGLSAKSENFLYTAFSKENDIEKATAYINLSQNIIQGYLIYLFLFIHTTKSPQSFFLIFLLDKQIIFRTGQNRKKCQKQLPTSKRTSASKLQHFSFR